MLSFGKQGVPGLFSHVPQGELIKHFCSPCWGEKCNLYLAICELAAGLGVRKSFPQLILPGQAPRWRREEGLSAEMRRGTQCHGEDCRAFLCSRALGFELCLPLPLLSPREGAYPGGLKTDSFLASSYEHFPILCTRNQGSLLKSVLFAYKGSLCPRS